MSEDPVLYIRNLLPFLHSATNETLRLVFFSILDAQNQLLY